MNRMPEEIAARRNQSHYDAGYDCELPAGARSELLGPGRPPSPDIKGGALD
jgi:hypothetical protein